MTTTPDSRVPGPLELVGDDLAARAGLHPGGFQVQPGGDRAAPGRDQVSSYASSRSPPATVFMDTERAAASPRTDVIAAPVRPSMGGTQGADPVATR